MARHAVGDPLVEEVLPEQPVWETPLAFFAALHYLALAGKAPGLAAAYEGEDDLWSAARAVLEENTEFVRAFVRDQPVQTNEVLRCWALLPAFLLATRRDPRPLALIELGPSGGLNLCWDRYRYRYEDVVWGPESPVELAGEWSGPFPRELFDTAVEVRRRLGIDRSPVDVTTREGALLLESFLWPDQPGRNERLRDAIEVLRRDPPELVRGDYVELLPGLLSEADSEQLTVVFSSASTVYLDDARFARLEESIAEAGERRPIAWVSMEPRRGPEKGDFFLTVRQWPGGHDEELAFVHYHGASVEWR